MNNYISETVCKVELP